MDSNKPRKPLAALTMSLVLPGLGQFYNGELNKAIWLFLAFAFLSIPGVALVALYLPDGLMMPTLVLSVIAALAIWIYGMADAWRGAKARPVYRPERWQISGVYLLLIIVCDIIALPLLTAYVSNHIVGAFRIPSASMEPTVLQGDFLFADKRYNCPGCKASIRRGDIAIFVYPNNRTTLYIKRIIALPGDQVVIRGGAVSVNGKPLASAADSAVETEDGRSWSIRPAVTGPNVTSEDGRGWSSLHTDQAMPNAVLEMTVPPGRVFVLGDNRADSYDSRDFGTVAMEDVVGRAKQIWLSFGHGGVRWERLGKVLQ